MPPSRDRGARQRRGAAYQRGSSALMISITTAPGLHACRLANAPPCTPTTPEARAKAEGGSGAAMTSSCRRSVLTEEARGAKDGMRSCGRMGSRGGVGSWDHAVAHVIMRRNGVTQRDGAACAGRRKEHASATRPACLVGSKHRFDGFDSGPEERTCGVEPMQYPRFVDQAA